MRKLTVILMMLCLIMGVAHAEIKLAPTETFKLDNGMTVILKENHSSPMITSVVFINAGARYESDYNNGVTHFLGRAAPCARTWQPLTTYSRCDVTPFRITSASDFPSKGLGGSTFTPASSSNVGRMSMGCARTSRL